MEINPNQKISDNEYLIGVYRDTDWELYVTNDRLLIVEKSAVNLWSPMLSAFAMFGNVIRSHKLPKDDLGKFKYFENGRYRYIISKESISKIEYSKFLGDQRFSIYDDEKKLFCTYRTSWNKDLLPLLREYDQNLLEIKK